MTEQTKTETGRKTIAVLPTGDWSEVTGEGVLIYEMTDEEYADFQNTGGEDTSLGKCVGSYSLTGFQQHQ